MTNLQFESQPSLVPALFRALFLPRKGYKQGQPWPQLGGQVGPLKADQKTYQRYAEVCQIPITGELPLLYPHIMASALHMQILTHPDFPLKLLGAVHLRNQIIQHRKIAVDEPILLKSSLRGKLITPKGIEFDFDTKATVNGELVWESLTTYYKPGKFGQPDAAESPGAMATLENISKVTSWYLKKNLGKAYAKVCNDYNPIHVSKLLAKLFGFKRDVAHGMGVLATAIHSVSPQSQTYPRRNDVIFKGPLFLESDVAVVQSASSPGRFDIYCGTNKRPSICFSLGSS